MEKRLPKPLKVLLIILGIIVGLLVVIVIGVNIYVRTAYSQFYDQAQEEFAQPGLAEGFIPQDLDYFDLDDAWLFSGYLGEGKPSPVYKQEDDGTFAKLSIMMPDGSLYEGHGSAITSTDEWVYLTCEEGYLAIQAMAFQMAHDGDTIQAEGIQGLDFSPAFMNIEDGKLYTGNFYYPEVYETPEHHRISTTDGEENPAVLYVFDQDEASDYGFSAQAQRVYSIPSKVQGVCLTDDEHLVLSTSYGIAPSHLLRYDLSLVTEDGSFPTGAGDVPLFILDSRSLVDDLAAPPMTEGIEGHEGLIYIASEAASNKYIFGKLYGAEMLYAVALDS